jgi:hypothetical protein
MYVEYQPQIHYCQRHWLPHFHFVSGTPEKMEVSLPVFDLVRAVPIAQRLCQTDEGGVLLPWKAREKLWNDLERLHTSLDPRRAGCGSALSIQAHDPLLPMFNPWVHPNQESWDCLLRGKRMKSFTIEIVRNNGFNYHRFEALSCDFIQRPLRVPNWSIHWDSPAMEQRIYRRYQRYLRELNKGTCRFKIPLYIELKRIPENSHAYD